MSEPEIGSLHSGARYRARDGHVEVHEHGAPAGHWRIVESSLTANGREVTEFGLALLLAARQREGREEQA